MDNVGAQEANWIGHFLVRDKDGNPKFDDWNNIPKEYLDVLTDKDLQFIESKKGI